jgi:hypothetical protein
MGLNIFDQFSILHFATGIISYFWGITLYATLIIHILFELFENTTYGMYFINTWITFWPGGKSNPDSLVNSISDTLFTSIGWIISYYLDTYYK